MTAAGDSGADATSNRRRQGDGGTQHWQAAMRPGTKALPLAAANFAIVALIPAAADASADQESMIRA